MSPWTRYCCIHNCASKRGRGDKENSKHLFRIPKDEESRNRWLHEIRPNLKKGRETCDSACLFICEDHFTEDCFRRDPIVKGKGKVKKFKPRKYLLLKSGIVPSIFKQVPDSSTALKNKDNVNIREMSPDSSRRADIAKRLMYIQAYNPIKESMFYPISDFFEESIGIYTMSNLLEDWNYRRKEIFPPFWELYGADDGQLTFSFNGDILNQLTRSILVKKDMSIEIRAWNQISSFQIQDKIVSLEAMRSTMMTITSLELCARACYGYCKNGLFVHTANMKSDICRDCQKQCTKEKQDEWRKKKRLEKEMDLENNSQK